MNDQNLLQRLIEIEAQCKKIRNSLTIIQSYLYIQLIIVIFYISFPWLYEYQKASIFYLSWRLLQYAFHLFSVIKIKKTVEIIFEVTQSRNFIEEINDQIDVWATVKGNHGPLNRCNEFVYVMMFGMGNVIFLQDCLLLSKWIIIIQLIFGWAVITALTLILLGIFIVLPILIYKNYRVRREETMRRMVIANGLVRNQIKYSDLENPSQQPCYICLSNYCNDDLIVKLTCNPNHIFHSDCIQPWALIKDTCPVCREIFQQQQ